METKCTRYACNFDRIPYYSEVGWAYLGIVPSLATARYTSQG